MRNPPLKAKKTPTLAHFNPSCKYLKNNVLLKKQANLAHFSALVGKSCLGFKLSLPLHLKCD